MQLEPLSDLFLIYLFLFDQIGGNQINPIWFRYNGKAGLPTDKKYVGVIAQEIEKIAPYLIEK